MLMPWEWPESRLIVSIRNRLGTESYLVGIGVTQVTFFEHYADRWNHSARDIRILSLDATPIDKETYDLLEESFPDDYKVGD